MGDNEEPTSDPDAATATVATRLTTLPPVQTEADLPDDAVDGTICYVHDQQKSFLYVDGAWSVRGGRGDV